MKILLFFFAAAGWVLELIVNVLSVNDVNVTERNPYVWFLHLAVFPLWIPVMIISKRNKKHKKSPLSGRLPRLNLFTSVKSILKNRPGWLSFVITGSSFYAILNFILFMFSQAGSVDIRNGQFVMHDHGKILKILTEQEYHHYRANEMRVFSAYALAFYATALGVFLPFKKKEEQIPLREA